MESPPSFSGWSETPISISEDSGLPLTCGSVSSGSVSGERVICEVKHAYILKCKDLFLIDHLSLLDEI